MHHTMEFSPNNTIVKFCLQGIGMEERGNPQEARRLFLHAWSEAANDFERFLAAYHVARLQELAQNRLQWFETTLQLAWRIYDDAVKPAVPFLHSHIAQCHEALGDLVNAEQHHTRARSTTIEPSDKGPFYHGTKADLRVGDLLTPGNRSNYSPDMTMNHVYFTALLNGAGLASTLAKGDGRERVLIVEPTGAFENDPNVTNKKFPGNPTRSYRTQAPLKITGEVADWARLAPKERQEWREKLARSKGDIIN